MADAQLWQVWRRPKEGRLRWEKAPGLDPMPRYDALIAMQQQELSGRADWEFSMIPVGDRPRESRFGGRGEPFFEGYRTKRMRPHGK